MPELVPPVRVLASEGGGWFPARDSDRDGGGKNGNGFMLLSRTPLDEELTRARGRPLLVRFKDVVFGEGVKWYTSCQKEEASIKHVICSYPFEDNVSQSPTRLGQGLFFLFGGARARRWMEAVVTTAAAEGADPQKSDLASCDRNVLKAAVLPRQV